MSNSTFSTAVTGLAVIVALALATWAVSVLKRDVSIVDSLWSIFIASAGLSYPLSSSGFHARAMLMLSLTLLWAIRLCAYLTLRNHGQPEDRRYQQIRARNQPHFALKSLYLVFGLQALLAWLVSMPLLAAARGATPLNLTDLAGAALTLFGIVFESAADQQMARFKRNAANAGRVMDNGLWRYTRHPNYFGECCVWWGLFLIALAAGNVWSVISPLLMTVLLLKVSGVTLLEADIGERRPAYRDYIARTNAFVPGKPGRRA